MRLSIVIPVGKKEENLRHLESNIFGYLKDKFDFEVIIVDAVGEITTSLSRVLRAKKKNRAFQMNLGATNARGIWLLFLHADSHLTEDALRDLDRTVNSSDENKVYYFNLAFDNNAPYFCKLNAVFANWRSRLWKIPFGDQGLLISKRLFSELLGFPETYDSGEDHAFMQRLRLRGYCVRPLQAKILTSGQKYKEHGWLSTTLRHLSLTYKQERTKRGVEI